MSVASERHDRQLFYILLDILIWSFLFPFVLPVVIVFSLIKFTVFVLMRTFRPDLNFISVDDLPVARATLDKKPIVDIGFVLRVDGDVDINRLKEEFRKNFVPVSTENVKVSDPFYSLHCTFDSFCGYLCKRKVERLNLDEQIRELSERVRDPQDFFSGWLHSQYRDERAARWEMLLVKALTGESYVAFRMHHGLIDGFGMLLIVDKLCGQESPYLVSAEPELTISEKLSMLLEMPRLIMDYWLMATKVSWPFASIADVDKVDKMLVSWSTLELGPIKEIRRRLKVPFATILYVLQTGALRRHLLETGRSDEITETLPVFHTIPKPNHPKNRFTNHWTFVKLHTPFSNENPLARIQETEELYKEFIRTRLHISGPMFFTGLVNLLPTAKYCLLNLQIPISVYKAALSSMVRSPNQYQLFGLNVTNIYHTFCTKDLCPQTILYTTTASHHDQIDITFSAAPDLVGDQKAMNRFAEKHLKDEMQDLLLRCQDL